MRGHRPTVGAGVYEDRESGQYDALSRRYWKEWSEHAVDRNHYSRIRTAYFNWMTDLMSKGIFPHDGIGVYCGPGYNVADNRDLDPSTIGSTVRKHPTVIIADFSRDVLLNAYDSIINSPSRPPYDIRLARRDFSHGLSARVDDMFMDKIDEIEDVHHMREFIEQVKDIGVEEVRRHRMPDRHMAEAHGVDIIAVDPDQGLCFKNIADRIAPVRFFVANMVLEGMLASTEKDFREKLMEVALRSNMEEDEVAKCLHVWHRLVLELNNEIAARFLVDALSAHPEAHVFTTNAVDAQYHDIPMDAVDRLRTKDIESRLQKEGIKLTATDQWTTVDSGETPPHTHTIRVICASKNTTGTGNNDIPQIIIPPVVQTGNLLVNNVSTPVSHSQNISAVPAVQKKGSNGIQFPSKNGSITNGSTSPMRNMLLSVFRRREE